MEWNENLGFARRLSAAVRWTEMVPAVTIIVPTCNRPNELAALFRVLLPQIPSDGSIELLVCDDSRTPTTKDMLERDFPSVIRLSGPRTGPGPNRNAGVRHARGNWLIFLDDDVVPRPTLVAAYLEAFADARMDGCLLAGATFRSGEHSKSLLWEAPDYVDVQGYGIPPSCNFAMQRDMYCASKGFDERFRYSFEDMEYFARLQQTGVQIIFVPAGEVDHPVRALPSATTLARRWEARVISSLDYGATPLQTSYLLPRHIVLVTLARFRGRRPSWENLLAAWVFLKEVVITFAMLPGWIFQYARRPLSPFWEGEVRKGKAPKNFGL